MKDYLKKKDPYEKHVPSVFIVCSPFQALCAIAAIKQLEITRYIVIICLPKEELNNKQVEFLLKKYNIIYKSVSPFFIKGWTFRALRLLALIPRNVGYNRLFIGDYRNTMELSLGYNYVRNGADVVFLDDGNPTINLLNDSESEPMPEKSVRWLNRIEKYRKLFYIRNLLTIYGDITNNKYNIKQLNLNEALRIQKYDDQHRGVYIIGTNVEGYCGSLNIQESIFISKLEELISTVCKQYPEDRIIYIPHRRETKDYAERLCQKYGCLFRFSETMIEVEAVDFPYPPKVIYGFTSNALFTLKKLYPESKVINILIEPSGDNLFYKDYILISEYYQKNGVELTKI